jgi:hypothetical protein
LTAEELKLFLSIGETPHGPVIRMVAPDLVGILEQCADRSRPATVTEMAHGQGSPSAEIRQLFGMWQDSGS